MPSASLSAAPATVHAVAPNAVLATCLPLRLPPHLPPPLPPHLLTQPNLPLLPTAVLAATRRCGACSRFVPLLLLDVASEFLLRLDAEGRAIDFDAWLLVVKLHLWSQYQQGVSMYAHMSGELLGPHRPTTLAAEATSEEREGHRVA
ncbi:unnamed protein product [Closterium sp. NIES-53]